MNESKIQHMYLHVDLDAFFASVEQMDHPEYKGKPVIVGGLPEDRRGVVSTASYEARKFGVHSAMPVYQAYRLCPQGIFVRGNMRRYAELSYQVMTIFKDFSPDVQQMSIDEALIDLTGTEKLFGPADQTALRIKERVKKETGLTVSVGLASTQYIAKIASGYSKPDGFYYVKPGEETDFMLSLPLDKIWGAGKKTQEVMKLKGIKTTRDIYEKDLDLLQFMFGNNLGSFLYNAVRGNEDMTFKHEAKNHSISAETTFPYDITDLYTAETALMELCYGVYFRLLRAESYSRTVTLKLRYEDFTTTNAQITFDRNITTLDDFFDKVKNLFEQKYEKGRGIRLLGAGFDNVETVERPYQQDLFETDNSKKTKIEKAILNLEKKHPEIKVQKARMLKSNLIGLIAGFGILAAVFCANTTKLYAKENTTEAKGAATLLPTVEKTKDKDNIPKSLFDWDINEASSLEFLVSGYWKASFENNFSLSFGNDSGVGFGFGVPIFKQEVDISFWAVLNKKWTFKADFADEFTKNTISLGYKGDGYLKSALISNRNITMPDNYAAAFFGYGLAGGDSQSPGFTMHFEDSVNSLWTGDFLVRYDMTEAKTATFYGLNNVTDSYISINNFEYGKTFVFPQEAWEKLSNIDGVYVESKNGRFSDKNGKKYVKLTADQYSILPASGKLLLSSGAGASINKTSVTGTTNIPAVLVTFSEAADISSIIATLGSYTNPESYLGSIQALFGDYNLQNYSYPLENKVDDLQALTIQNSTGFSPFLVCQTYDCGIIKDADVLIISKNSEKQNTSYKTEITNDEAAATVSNFFVENHKYVKIFSTESNSADLQNPLNRYPFVLSNPEIYLNLEPKTDTTLLVRTYSKVSSFNIGNSAIAGTVQVYKNGNLDLGAKYDANTGNVTLSSSVENTDKIYIIWQEDSTDVGGGALVAGAGFNYFFNPKLKSNLAITSRWPVTPFKKYSTVQNLQKSFTALSAGIDYTTEHFSASEKLALSMENQNGTGVLLAATQDSDISKTYYLSSGSGYKTLVTPTLNTRNKIILEDSNNYSLPLRAAETEVNNITGYKVPLDFDFSTSDANQLNWASVDIQLSSGNQLKNSSQLEIALKNSCDMTGYDFYLQLGINASNTFYGEETEVIPTWKINSELTDGLFDFTSTEWQSVTLQFEDLTRSKLTSYHDARLIIVKPEASEVINNSGTVYIGPYEPYTQIVFTKADSNIVLNTQTKTCKTPSSSELLITQNNSTVLSWNYLSQNILPTDNTIIQSVNYFGAADFSSYRTINLDFAYTVQENFSLDYESQSPYLELILDTNAKNIDSNGTVALRVLIKDISPYLQKEITFHTLSADIISNQVFIDNIALAEADFELELNKSIIPDRQKITFDTRTTSSVYTKGAFYIDNLYYKETNPGLLAQNNINLSYNYENGLVTINNYDVIKNLELNLNSTQSAQTSITSENNTSAQIISSAKAGITLTDVNFSADINFKTDSDPTQIVQNAGHTVKTEVPLFKILTLNETYRFSNTEDTLKKSDGATVDFSKLKVPLKLDFSAAASEGSYFQNQNGQFAIDITPAINKAQIKVNSTLKVNQKISQLTTNKYSDTNNYFFGYSDISAIEFSTGNEEAQNRDIDFTSKAGISLPWYNFSPSAEYDLSSKYINSSEVTLKDNHVIKVSLPMTVSRNSFAFTYTRTGIGETSITAGGNYFEDSQKFFSEFNNRQYFYTSIPFYDLFNKSTSSKMVPEQLGNISNTLSSKYELLWKRKLLNSYKDLFIPTATSFAISRDIKYTEAISDLYQIKAILSNNAINCFGNKSQLKLFDWYEHEEVQSSLTGIVKIPYGQADAITFQTTLYNQILFYITDKTTLQTAVDFSIETNLDWSVRSTFIWQRPGTTTFIIPLVMLIKPIQEANPNWKITRKDTLNIQIGRKELINNQLYEAYHNVDINFFEYYTITAGVGLDFNYIQNSKDTLSLKFTIGGKMEF